jgi:hypothetical protein
LLVLGKQLVGTSNFNDGSSGAGEVFTLTPAGAGYAFDTVYTFNGRDGETPSSPLILGTNGVLYGQTLYGGPNHGGTVYELSPTKSGYALGVLHRFLRKPAGLNPYGPLLFANGALFGSTSSGGDFGEDGTIFEIVP